MHVFDFYSVSFVCRVPYIRRHRETIESDLCEKKSSNDDQFHGIVEMPNSNWRMHISYIYMREILWLSSSIEHNERMPYTIWHHVMFFFSSNITMRGCEIYERRAVPPKDRSRSLSSGIDFTCNARYKKKNQANRVWHKALRSKYEKTKKFQNNPSNTHSKSCIFSNIKQQICG